MSTLSGEKYKNAECLPWVVKSILSSSSQNQNLLLLALLYNIYYKSLQMLETKIDKQKKKISHRLQVFWKKNIPSSETVEN